MSLEKKRTRWNEKRHTLQVILLLIFLLCPHGIPFIESLEQGIVKWDFANNQFHFFGITFFGSQRYIPLSLVFIFLYTLFVLSALYSKVFCGWGCPQNMFFEVFEEVQRRFRKRYPKFRKSLRMQKGLDALMSCIIAFTLAWTSTQYTSGLSIVPWTFLFVLVLLFVFFDLHYLKHRFCTYACPYGVIQKSLQFSNSLHVQWDQARDTKCGICTACEKACYMDINVRETPFHVDCTMCGACIDACDRVYSRSKEASLLQFSFEGTKNSRWGLNTLSKKGFVIGWFLMLAVWSYIVFTRPEVSFRMDYAETKMIQEQVDLAGLPLDHCNLYKARVQNLTKESTSYKLSSSDDRFEVIYPKDAMIQDIQATEERVVFVIIKDKRIDESREPVLLQLSIMEEESAKRLETWSIYYRPHRTMAD